MNWRSVKLVLCVLLLAAGIYLGFSLYSVYSSGKISDEAVRNITELLAASDIGIAPDTLTNKQSSGQIYSGQVYSSEGEYYLAAFSCFDSPARGVNNLTPDGVYLLSENGDSFVCSNYTDFEYRSNRLGVSDPLTYSGSTVRCESVEYYEKLLSSVYRFDASQSDKLSLRVASVQLRGGSACVFAVMTLAGLDIADFSADFIFDGDTLIYAQGKWAFTSLSGSVSSPLFDQLNILTNEKKYIDGIRAAAEDGEQPGSLFIESVTGAYICTYSVSGQCFVFTPAWIIDYSSADDAVYNAVSGERAG